jgi:hypothetical protein
VTRFYAVERARAVQVGAYRARGRDWSIFAIR